LDVDAHEDDGNVDGDGDGEHANLVFFNSLPTHSSFDLSCSSLHL
jgi:hypothetical protein